MRYQVEKRTPGYFVVDTEHPKYNPAVESNWGVISFSTTEASAMESLEEKLREVRK